MSRRRTMREEVEDYLARRRALGFELRIAGQQLLAFARIADRSGHRGPLIVDLVARWAMEKTRTPCRFPGRRLEVVRPFARDLAALDGRSQVPPIRLLGPPRRRPTPFIYSDRQVRALIAAARQLAPRGGLRLCTYAVLFGLLAVCGLRISEALDLDRRDVDLHTGMLTIRDTKFRKSRVVPLHSTSAAALRAYAARRDRIVPASITAPFFLSALGTHLPYTTVRAVFRGLVRRVVPREGARPPRMHDLRHTFACRRLLLWCRAGDDVHRRIDALSSYLGHAKITDTYWYLTATPELLSVAAAKFSAFTARADRCQS